MKTLYRHGQHFPARFRRQRGTTLFFAMIGLVVLLLAAAALVRSVDTSTLIVGNLSFRQSATHSAERGMERAIQWLNNTLIDPGAAVGSVEAADFAENASNTTTPAVGYYRSSGEVDIFNTGAARYAWANGNNTDLGTDVAGNRVRFVVERMCSLDWLTAFSSQKLDKEGCLFTQIETSESHKGGVGYAIKPARALVFRITVRVDGPRNTVSYVQGFVF